MDKVADNAYTTNTTVADTVADAVTADTTVADGEIVDVTEDTADTPVAVADVDTVDTVEAEQAALPGNPGPLRRSRTRNDLHLVDMNAGNQATLNWRGLAEAEFSAHRDGARSLRLRPQWDLRRQRAAFGGDT